jgi:hypothetical protein
LLVAENKSRRHIETRCQRLNGQIQQSYGWIPGSFSMTALVV